ncbi:MAG: hypothetical protein U0270_36725 [Labilithrix sp.]
MTTPEERIKELARKNAIGSVDAARLLASVKPTTPVAAPGFDPFRRYGAGLLAGAGVIAGAASLALAPLHVHFPGFLDIMRSDAAIGTSRAWIEQAAAFPLAAAVFWVAGRLAVGRGARPVDMLATVGFARVPAVLFALPVALSGVTALALLTLVGLALQILLLVLGFRSATGATGGRLAAGVVGGIVAAEVLAKLLVSVAP